MKQIKRIKYPSILKKEISTESLETYEKIDIHLVTKLLNETIEDYTYNTIDLLELLRVNYQDNLVETIKNISSYKDVRFNCYYATKILQEKLNRVGITSYIITYKSIGFSSNFGDKLIKEAHMALIIPTIRNNEIYYLLLDPGLRIPCILEFYASSNKTVIEIDHDRITIEATNDKEYPYAMEMIGYNRYSQNPSDYKCKEYFSLLETINPEEVLFPASYEILDGYRIINFKVDNHKWAVIKLMIIDEYLECFDISKNLKLSFQELRKMSEEQLVSLLQPFVTKLKVNIQDLIKNIYFILDHHNEFISNVINPQVLKEKLPKKEKN